MKEYVYILTNHEFPGKVKIGRTEKHPEIRTEQLNKQTGTIGKYKCEFFIEFENSEIIEKTMHFLLNKFHYDKEFFTVSLEFSKKLLSIVYDEFQYLNCLKYASIDHTNEETLDLINAYNVMIELEKSEGNTLKRTIEACQIGMELKKFIKPGT